MQYEFFKEIILTFNNKNNFFSQKILNLKIYKKFLFCFFSALLNKIKKYKKKIFLNILKN